MSLEIVVPRSLCSPDIVGSALDVQFEERGEECCCQIDKRGNVVMHLESRDYELHEHLDSKMVLGNGSYKDALDLSGLASKSLKTSTMVLTVDPFVQTELYW